YVSNRYPVPVRDVLLKDCGHRIAQGYKSLHTVFSLAQMNVTFIDVNISVPDRQGLRYAHSCAVEQPDHGRHGKKHRTTPYIIKSAFVTCFEDGRHLFFREDVRNKVSVRLSWKSRNEAWTACACHQLSQLRPYRVLGVNGTSAVCLSARPPF
ncbi:MAG: hypothetical protein LKF81_11090, partial [Prevotella sp.]|nr:hypothetical protein [Prevotella sp.]